MISMLGLVSIGVFGACLSALLCMITDVTPCGVPKLISFEKGSLRPRIISSANSSQSKNENLQNNEKRRNKIYQSQRRCEKREPEITKNYRRHVQTSISNLKNYVERKIPKLVTNLKEYSEDADSSAASDAIRNSWKYHENEEISRVTPFELKEKSLIGKNVTKTVALQDEKIDDDNCTKCGILHNNKWTKVRTKKKHFILPRSLVIAKKPNNLKKTDDPIDKNVQLNERYCYLEALRIKTNKVKKNL